ncbi:hypothetical protein RR48_09163 [Papilio machaon]|uniref:Uncharacterized protein n=1 Tax=Papilio machaon TaxID=76193 RepID=A0A194RGT1_PAPMA|nr:hypothetical protein RR48_09163 [Papilio machaon]
MARSALRVCPVRARRSCRDTKERGAAGGGLRAPPRPPRTTPHHPALPPRRPNGGRQRAPPPVARRSHVGSGACAHQSAPPCSHRHPAAALDPAADRSHPATTIFVECTKWPGRPVQYQDHTEDWREVEAIPRFV